MQTVYQARIERIVEHTADIRSFFLRLPTGQRLLFKPGQFLSFFLSIVGEKVIRPYSIASDPEEGNLLEICLNLVPGGLGSQFLFERRVGETLHFTGPWGTFFLEEPPQEECVFIADGTGIVPIRPMIKRALSVNSHVLLTLLYSAATKGAFLYQPEFVSFAAKQKRFCFAPSLTNPSIGWQGLCGSLFNQIQDRYVFADENRTRRFYICGVGSQVTALRDLLRQAGYQRRAVQYEKW